MSDTPAAPTIMEKPKLTVKDLGNPKLVTSDNPRVILGKIIGSVTKVKNKVDAKGEVFQALVGTFEGVSEASKNVIRSGVLYLPGGFHDAIVETIEAGADRVDFAYEIAAVHASNPIGYSYAMRPLFKPSADDPLSRMREAAGIDISAATDALPAAPQLAAAPQQAALPAASEAGEAAPTTAAENEPKAEAEKPKGKKAA